MIKKVSLLLLCGSLTVIGMEKDEQISALATKYTNQIIDSILPAEKIKESLDDAQFCLKETIKLIQPIKLTQHSEYKAEFLDNLTTLEQTLCGTELQQKLIAHPFEVCYTINSLSSIITILVPQIEPYISSDQKKLAVEIIGRIVLANARMQPFRDQNVKAIIENNLQSSDSEPSKEELSEFPLENNNYNTGD